MRCLLIGTKQVPFLKQVLVLSVSILAPPFPDSLSRHAIIFCLSMHWGWMSSRSAKWQTCTMDPGYWVRNLNYLCIWVLRQMIIAPFEWKISKVFSFPPPVPAEVWTLLPCSRQWASWSPWHVAPLVACSRLRVAWTVDQICNMLLILARYLLHVGHSDYWSLPHAGLIASSLLHKTSLSISASRCSSLFLTSTACWSFRSLISEKV